jgi:hypothetical protein
MSSLPSSTLLWEEGLTKVQEGSQAQGICINYIKLEFYACRRLYFASTTCIGYSFEGRRFFLVFIEDIHLVLLHVLALKRMTMLRPSFVFNQFLENICLPR